MARPLFDATLEAMRPPVVPEIPTEENPHPVPGHPGWGWWPGEHGYRYARRTDGVRVQGHHWLVLLARIDKADDET